MKKRCSQCKEFKLLSEFYKNSTTKDGLQNYCNKCHYESNGKYYRTKKGIISKMYDNQIRSSKNRCHPKPKYSRQELIKWTLNESLFHKLYDNWVKSNYDKYKKPSIDRKNDYKGYSFENIQLMTWKENEDKNHNDSKNGINTKQCKSVNQYDLNGKLIKKHYSMCQAAREVGILNGNISNVCSGIRKTAGGFKWAYAK